MLSSKTLIAQQAMETAFELNEVLDKHKKSQLSQEELGLCDELFVKHNGALASDLCKSEHGRE